MTRPLASAAEVSALFSLNAETGVVTRLVDRGGRNAGARVGCLRPDGYLTVMISKRPVLVHRVVWCLAYGEWPTGEVDHINGVRSDNRLANLRVTTHRGNCLNQTKGRESAVGEPGVDRLPNGSFRARLKKPGRSSHLGVFTTIEAARYAVAQARRAEMAEEAARCS